jgi:hypothetical protein
VHAEARWLVLASAFAALGYVRTIAREPGILFHGRSDPRGEVSSDPRDCIASADGRERWSARREDTSTEEARSSLDYEDTRGRRWSRPVMGVMAMARWSGPRCSARHAVTSAADASGAVIVTMWPANGYVRCRSPAPVRIRDVHAHSLIMDAHLRRRRGARA